MLFFFCIYQVVGLIHQILTKNKQQIWAFADAHGQTTSGPQTGTLVDNPDFEIGMPGRQAALSTASARRRASAGLISRILESRIALFSGAMVASASRGASAADNPSLPSEMGSPTERRKRS